jgi:TetR/AcrR family transcriptional regulator, transcriptional repressor for nem operon
MPRRRRVPRSRKATTQATHEALIDAALEEFAEVGLDASLDNICARAKLTRGAFYVHFADREALIVAVMQRVLGGFVSRLTASRAASAIDQFFAAAQASAPEVHGGRALRFFHLLDACHRSQRVGDTYRALIRGGRDQLATAIAADPHVRSDIAPAALADFMTITALGVVAMLELDLGLDLAKLRSTARSLGAAR